MVKKGYFILSIILLATLLLSFASANYIIAGTVFDGTVTTTKENVSVTITCDSNTLTTTSLSDGTYGVVFGVDSCSSVIIDANGYNASKIERYVDPSAYNPTGGSGTNTGGRYFLCGNGVCDTGETASTCAKDCSATPLQTLSAPANEIETTEEEENTGRSWLTGSAILDFAGSGAGIASIVGIVLVLLIIIYILYKKKNSKKEEKK